MEVRIVLDEEAKGVVATAHRIARQRWESHCGTEHLLLALIKDVRHVRQAARRLGFADHLLDAADYEPRHMPPDQPPTSPRLNQVLARAEQEATQRGEPVNVVDLSWSLLQKQDSGAATWLMQYADTHLATFREAVHGEPDGHA